MRKERKRIGIKNERGSITLFVLLSGLFFLLLVTSVSIYVTNKATAQEDEYQKIKQGYESVTPDIDEKPQVNIPELWEETDSSNENNQWYAYTDISNNKIADVNPPELEGNMTPIRYTGDSTGSQWANACTTDGSMWVWIPRYAYKITDGYHTNSAGTIEIAFLDTGNNFLNGETGTIVTDPADVTYTNNVQNEWLVHPAFTANAENGGGFGEISGIWIAKYEISGTLDTESGFKSMPGVSSLNNDYIGDFYTYARQQLYGEKGSKDKEDGYMSFGNSHMIKNSEWGVAVYLSYSVYGTNKKEIEKTPSSYYTGGTTSLETIYTTNALQSTTLNPYGIYDMVGLGHEAVAAYVNGSADLSIEAGELYGTTEEEHSTSTKYKTVYLASSDESPSSNYKLSESIKGDAIYETSDMYDSDSGTWQYRWAKYPASATAFFLRGGTSNADTTPGIFYFIRYSRGSVGDIGCHSRLALVF